MRDILRRWRVPAALRAADTQRRWVVVDTETTGLDPERDALLAIGGVAIDDEGVRVGDSFEVVLNHAGPIDAANVAVHGLGHAMLAEGAAPAVALDDFRRWVNDAPCAAFHAGFDRRILERAAAIAAVRPVHGPWLDLAPLAAALRPSRGEAGIAALDAWLTEYGIDCVGRHTAAGDALASAEMLLRMKAEAAAQGRRGFAGLHALIRAHRWLGSRQ